MKTLDQIRATLPKREERTFPGLVELRAKGDNGDPKIGLTIPYGKRSEVLWDFVEIIEPSAFRKTLSERGDIVSLWNHDPAWVLGRQSNRTLDVRNSDEQLEAVVTLDGADPMHQHFARRVERRDVQGSSFGFETVRDEWETEADGTVVRHLIEAKLFELSAVTFPAYPDSGAESRSRAVFDIASVRCGGDLADLAAVLVRVEGGKVVEADIGEIRSWLDRLTELLPAPPAVRVGVRERELQARARALGLVA